MKKGHVLAIGALLLGAFATHGAQKPAQPAAQSKRISLKSLTCGQWLSLPDDIRPLAAAWVHGFFYREQWTDAWEFDVERVRSTLSALGDACKESTTSLFRYKFGEVLKKRAAESSR